MVFGDARGDVHAGFTLLHTVFLRNHNNLAEKLHQKHQDWNDEKIYQEARKINAALMQHITYTQYLDVLLGEGKYFPKKLIKSFSNFFLYFSSILQVILRRNIITSIGKGILK